MSPAKAALTRVALFWAAFWFVLTGLRSLPLAILGDWDWVLFGSLITIASILLVTFLTKKEDRHLRAAGLVWGGASIGQLTLGTVIGMIMAGLMFAVLVLFNSVKIVPVQTPDYLNALGFVALLLLILSLMEEVVFRSYPFFTLAHSFGPRTTIYVTSVVFAFYHGLNPANLLGPGVWGLFFGLTAIRTGSIAFPVGLHFGLNWMQGLFGLKPEYGTSLWVIELNGKAGGIPAESVGLGLQIFLMILGVVLIEHHVRSPQKSP